MAQGKVTVNNLNLGQGNFPEIERKALFIGVGTKNIGSILSINPQSDLTDLLGVVGPAGGIKENIAASLLNVGDTAQFYAAPIAANGDWKQALAAAMAVCSVEIIALCIPAATDQDLIDAQDAAEQLRATRARRVIVLRATNGITNLQTWSEYEAAQAAITEGVRADRVGAVPQLHGCDLGALVGRLCNRSVSIADSPMRVRTGTVSGLGEHPKDKDGVELTDATLATLDANRLTVIQRYVDYPGIYFGDCNLLDAPGGDYQVIEHMRVMDKACRAVRILAIGRVADRLFNNTSASTAAHKTYFERPLREMSKRARIGDLVFPGEIEPPKDDSITIIWPGQNKVEVYIKVRPYKSPKDITANLILDLSDVE